MNLNLIKPPHLMTSLPGKIRNKGTCNTTPGITISHIHYVRISTRQMSKIFNKYIVIKKKEKVEGTYRLRETYEIISQKQCADLEFGSDSNKSSVKMFLIQLGKTEHRLHVTCGKEVLLIMLG